LGFLLDLCCGGDFTTTWTARSKRSQASGRSSTSFFDVAFAKDAIP